MSMKRLKVHELYIVVIASCKNIMSFPVVLLP